MCGSFPNQSACVLWTILWGGAEGVWDVWGVVKRVDLKADLGSCHGLFIRIFLFS